MAVQYELPPPPPEIQPQRWFVLLYRRIVAANIGAIAWLGLDFSLSNMTSIVTRNHNDLQNIQGGASGDYQHLTTAQLAKLTGIPTGLSVTITTAKLTSGGTNGSMTFTNGVLTAQTPAT